MGLEVFQYKSGNFWTALAPTPIPAEITCRLMSSLFPPWGDAIANIQQNVKREAVQPDRSTIFSADGGLLVSFIILHFATRNTNHHSKV